MTTLQESIAHWVALAVEAEEFASYEEAMGWSGASYRNKAELYRRTARALRMEMETGRPHCACCLKPQGARGSHA